MPKAVGHPKHPTTQPSQVARHHIHCHHATTHRIEQVAACRELEQVVLHRALGGLLKDVHRLRGGRVRGGRVREELGDEGEAGMRGGYILPVCTSFNFIIH